MPLKRIYLPTIMFTPRWIADKSEWDDETREKLAKRSDYFNEQIKKAETTMDEALNQGFEYITQYTAKSDSEEGVTFIFHKAAESEEIEITRGAGPLQKFKLEPRPKSERDAAIAQMMRERGLPESEAALLIDQMDALFEDTPDDETD